MTMLVKVPNTDLLSSRNLLLLFGEGLIIYFACVYPGVFVQRGFLVLKFILELAF